MSNIVVRSIISIALAVMCGCCVNLYFKAYYRTKDKGMIIAGIIAIVLAILNLFVGVVGLIT